MGIVTMEIIVKGHFCLSLHMYGTKIFYACIKKLQVASEADVQVGIPLCVQIRQNCVPQSHLPYYGYKREQ